jgi:hypothetical protein
MKLYMFRAVRLPINCSSILVLLESCLQTCMTYTSAEFTVNKLLMTGRGTAPKHVEFHAGVNLGNWCIWLVFIINKHDCFPTENQILLCFLQV